MERLTSSERGDVWNRPNTTLTPHQYLVLGEAYEQLFEREPELTYPDKSLDLDERRRAYVGAFLVAKGFEPDDVEALPEVTIAEISKRAPDGNIDDEELVADGLALQQMTEDALSDTIVA